MHSCFVDDTSGARQELIDADGCAIDKFLLQNVEYIGEMMAGVEAHVFKFADRPAL